jgi:hypothetical protein
MISAGDDALDAELAAWEAMTDEERDAAAQEWLDDLAAAALEWRESTERDAAQYAADVTADAEWEAAQMAEAERAQAPHIAAEDARIAGALVQVGPYTYADPKCRQCRGTGVVSDTVDYGSTTAQLESACDCAVDYMDAVTNGEGIEYGNLWAVQVLVNGACAFGEFATDGHALWTQNFPTPVALLDACAAIAPLTAWAVVWDDQGADDAPKF